MTRVRISTTVDADRLHRCRALLDAPDSELLDRAIALLLMQLTAEHERTALEAQPYETDPDVAWVSEPGPDLPYDGAVPGDVHALAERRRTT